MTNAEETKAESRFWLTLQALDRRWLYLILVLIVSWLVLQPIEAPNVVSTRSEALYDYLSGLDEGDVVLVESNWTNSTRGESRGQFQALMRLLMRKKIKFVITAIADPQAPNIAREVIESIAKEPGSNNYQENVDWVMAGYFPNGENHVMSMVNDVRKELATKGIEDSPVMEGINDLSDMKAIINVTASATILIWYERIRNKAPIGLMCTAVMSAENIPYFVAGQLEGLVIGAKGGFDFETLLAEEFPDTNPEFSEYTNFESGRRYMSPLAFALMLLVLSVVAGNVAMYMLRRGGERS
ncbi:MAG: hypothetical protein IH851_08110 [Armatimonadetes bacterium]|nr:hypothetical protein [Armatimonadota bacterium]